MKWWGGYVGLPVLGLAGYFLAAAWMPAEFRHLLYWERGIIELGTAACFAAAGCLAAALMWKTRGFVPLGYRILYALFALAALFVALEEISWGQHLFGWEARGWFAENNFQQETNLHNLYGDRGRHFLYTLAGIAFPTLYLVLPACYLLSRRGYQPGHWTSYLLPRGELLTIMVLDQLLRVSKRLPVDFVEQHSFLYFGLEELREFCWSAASLLFVVVVSRRILNERPVEEEADDGMILSFVQYPRWRMRKAA